MASEEADLDKIVSRDLTSRFQKSFVKFEGIPMPDAYMRIKVDIDNFDVKEDDVWICSYPKTGTTWTQEMVWMILNGLDFKGGKVPLPQRSPFLEYSGIYDIFKMSEELEGYEPSHQELNSVKYVKQCSEKGPACLKTHLPWVLLPKEIKGDIKRPKIIYVCRNPKDTCVSFFHHSKLLTNIKASFEDFCKVFLAGKYYYGLYWDHVIPFWIRRNQPNILFIRFEDMVKDLPNVIRQVANFLERPLSEDQVEILANHLSFENMKTNPALNSSDFIAFLRKFNATDDKDGSFIRSGKVGGYKTEMTDEMVKKFDEKTEQYRKLTDFSF